MYHYLSWMYGPMNADSVLGRIGIFGVSIFFILSGATLYIIYNSRLSTFTDHLLFFKRRIFRIYPLMWIVLTVSIFLSNRSIVFSDVILNYTGLFGFVSWDKGLATGIWSIGNELVYYSVFPIILYLIRKVKPFSVFILFLFLDYLFQSSQFNDYQVLLDQGYTYFNPLNSAFLFVSGCVIGGVYKSGNFKVKNWLFPIMMIAAIIGFIYWPVFGDRIHLITNFNRYIFYTFCIALVYSVIHFDIKGSILTAPFQLLGESSYSLYLIHPLVFTVLNFGIAPKLNLNPYSVLILSILFSVLTSFLIYRYFEKFFIQLGKK